MKERWGYILAGIIVVLALADGLLHLLLDFILFGGSLIGSGPPPEPPPGPPPGAPAGGAGPPPGPPRQPFPLPLNELFLLNFIGYVVLVLVFWFSPRWLGARRWVVDVVLIVYTAASIVAWLQIGRPNPHGLGYVSKAMEVVLILALAAHIRYGSRPRGAVRRAA